MKRKIITAILSIVVIIVLGTVVINTYMIESTKKSIVSIDDVESLSDIDAILVLGCKAYDYGPSMMLENRLERGTEVYKILNTKIILSGDHSKKEYDEVNVMKDYLLERDINRSDIFLDHAGLSTYDSIYRAKNVFKANKIIIVTQYYHMSRALYIAKNLGLEAYGVIASDIPYRGIMIKNELREILARNKNFVKSIFEPESKYVGDEISLDQDGIVTEG